MSFLEGFFTGLSTLIFIGPVLALLLLNTIKNGYKYGLSFAFGIIISDVIIAIFSYYGIALFLKPESNGHFWFSIIGGLFMLILGFYYLFKDATFLNKNIKPLKSNSLTTFITGFSINFFNPFVFGFWILLSNYGKNKYNEKVILYLAGIILGILCIDLIKIYFSKNLHKFIQSNRLNTFMKFTGLLFILYSFKIFYDFIF